MVKNANFLSRLIRIQSKFLPTAPSDHRHSPTGARGRQQYDAHRRSQKFSGVKKVKNETIEEKKIK
jgi:hypothetical protein